MILESTSGTILEGIFLYAGIAGMFTFVTLLRDGWHEVAAIMWSLMSLMYFVQFGTCYVVAGMVPAIAHGYLAVLYYKKNREATAVVPEKAGEV